MYGQAGKSANAVTDIVSVTAFVASCEAAVRDQRPSPDAARDGAGSVGFTS
jgi:hypothetical protein